MPQFRFSLVGQGQEVPLGEPVELPDVVAAETHVKMAILKVFPDARGLDWSKWRVSICDGGQQAIEVPISETLSEMGRLSTGDDHSATPSE